MNCKIYLWGYGDIMRKLRFWVQKVLPLVYDDSLSYYELLCKVVHKINEIIDNLEKMGGQIEDLYDINITDAVKEILNGWLEDGTLEDLINDTLNHPDKIVISSFLGKDSANSNITYGDCCVISGSVNGIIDFGYEPSCFALKGKLLQLGVNKLDFCVISHYHNDHITTDFAGALSNLIGAGIDFSECTFYLPHKGINWGSFTGNEENWQARETAVKSTLTTNGIRWVEPDDLEEFQLTTGIKLRFSNIGNYTDYYGYMLNQNQVNVGHTMYNQFSMVTEIYVYDRVALFTGDITAPAQSLLAGLYRNVDIYKIEHHAMEQYCPPKWLNAFKPEVTLLCNYSSLYVEEPWRLLRPSLTSKANQGSIICQSRYNPDIELNFYGALILNGNGFDPLIITTPSRNMLQEGTDLNNVRNVGVYCSYNEQMTRTMLNVPCVWGGFTLEVKQIAGADTAGRLQVFYPNTLNVNGFWIRYITSSGVGTWRFVETTDYVITE